MRNYVSEGVSFAIASAPYNVLSGQGVAVGRLFGIAQSNANIAGECVIVTEGVFDIAKTANDVFAVGAAVFFNAVDLKAHSNADVDSNSGGTLAIGICVQAAGVGALTVRTKLTPQATA